MVKKRKNKKRSKKVFGTAERPRLIVNKSIKHISAQLIDDVGGITIVSAVSDKNDKNNISSAEKVGKDLAEKAKSKGVKVVVFDRGNYIFHGKVKALADGARSVGLEF